MKGPIPVLLMSNRFTSDSQLLWRVASGFGWSVVRHSLSDLSKGLPNAIPSAVYGETLFVETLRQSKPDLELLELSPSWLSTLPRDLLGRVVSETSLSRVRGFSGAEVFVKPIVDKQFEARVYRVGREEVAPHVDGAAQVLVSEPVSFEVEARLFVAPEDRGLRVVTTSTYLRGGEPRREPLVGSELSEVTSLVESAFSLGFVPVPTVLDVGLLGRRWVFVEANPAWGSAIYACDPVGVLSVLERCVKTME